MHLLFIRMLCHPFIHNYIYLHHSAVHLNPVLSSSSLLDDMLMTFPKCLVLVCMLLLSKTRITNTSSFVSHRQFAAVDCQVRSRRSLPRFACVSRFITVLLASYARMPFLPPASFSRIWRHPEDTQIILYPCNHAGWIKRKQHLNSVKCRSWNTSLSISYAGCYTCLLYCLITVKIIA